MAMQVVIQADQPLKVLSNVADINTSYLKENYLKGLEFVDQNSDPWPDSLYDKHISNAIAQFERLTKVDVLRRTVTGEPHDYYISDYQLFAFFQLWRWPIIDDGTIQVTAVYPTGQTVIQFPTEWIRALALHGQLNLVPTQGTLSQVILGQGGSYLPLIYQTLGYLPALFQVNYTSGWADGTLPMEIIDAVCKLACISILSVAQDTVFIPGVTSMSAGIDGLSQGMGVNPRGVFYPRISLYKADLFGDRETGAQGAIKDIKDEYHGINMQVA